MNIAVSCFTLAQSATSIIKCLPLQKKIAGEFAVTILIILRLHAWGL